jgi:DNA topoisomerase-1
LSPKEKGLRTYFLDEENNIVEKFNKDTVAEVAFQDEESAKKLVKSLSKDYEIYMVEKPRLKTSNPKAPFTTSAVNQAAIGLLGMTAGRVRGLLQQLFEGINIGGKHEALITYPRTDSTRISPTFISKAKLFIEKAYGKKEFIFRD